MKNNGRKVVPVRDGQTVDAFVCGNRFTGFFGWMRTDRGTKVAKICRCELTWILFHDECLFPITANGLWKACLITILFNKMHY